MYHNIKAREKLKELRQNTVYNEEITAKLQLNTPISLFKLSAVKLGRKYIEEQLTVEQAKADISRGSLVLSKKINSIIDVFRLNCI